MKQIIGIFLLFLALFLFSGCSSQNKYMVVGDNTGNIYCIAREPVTTEYRVPSNANLNETLEACLQNCINYQDNNHKCRGQS